ncbi:NAD(P)-dependent oxidoreductase [Pelagibacteraceae bacterium]|nr:NAD(P)-dependent oxidoreductase [Pelagibacteraceae bacterium]
MKNKILKKIIITGGLGHIGSYLCERFLKTQKNLHLVIIDSLHSKRYTSLFNLNKKKNNRLSFYDLDVKKLDDNDKIFFNAKIIIHMAAMAEAENSIKFQSEYRKNNLDSTKKIIGLAKKNNSLLIFPSSTSVYGTSINNDIIYESDQKKILPQSPYAKIKLSEENLIKKRLKNNKFVILRLGTIIGVSKGMRFGTAVNKFCYQASLNKEITVWKNAYLQIRPYATLEDVFKSIYIFVKYPKQNINTVYNIVTKNLSVKNIIDFIKERKKIKVRYVTSKIMNNMSYMISNNKVMNIGFLPQKNLKNLIFKTLDLFNIDNERIR